MKAMITKKIIAIIAATIQKINSASETIFVTSSYLH
jgi:hypothetical protein